jgi:alpha-beta hydrolase superfamily lysophospholipase
MQSLSFDVGDVVPSSGPLQQSAWAFLPENPLDSRAVLLCLAGGTYDKRYWHLTLDDFPGYSFAEHLAWHGYIVVALDHLGVGDSADPLGQNLSLELLARGDAAVAEQLSSRLRTGSLLSGVPALDLPMVGVGHSMGSCLTTMVQAQVHPYDAVVLLGYGVQVANVHERGNSAETLEERIVMSEAAFRELNGVAPGTHSCLVPRDHLRSLFHAPDVPAEVIAADDAAESRVPVRAASEVITPGYVQRYAAMIDVPIFLGLGAALDVSPDPAQEIGYYGTAADITLYMVEGSAHCHNFASERVTLWDRIASWISTVVSAETLRQRSSEPSRSSSSTLCE